MAPFTPFRRLFAKPYPHPHHKQSLLRYLFPSAGKTLRERYRERLLKFHLDTVPYYKHRLQSRIYRYILSRQSRRLAKTRWVDRIAQNSRRLLLGSAPRKPNASLLSRKATKGQQRKGDALKTKALEQGDEKQKSSSGSSSTGRDMSYSGYSSGPGGAYGREQGSRRKKLADMAKSVYNAGVATASEIRNQYDNTRVRGVVDMNDESFKTSIPGSFPDVAIVTRGQEEMVIFPSYAKRHVRQFRDDGSKIHTYAEGDPRNTEQTDEEYWRNEWARAEDKKAVVDVDVRGWVYSPHRGPMTRKNRVLIGLARRLSGIPAPTHANGGLQGLSTGHEEREELREEQKIAKEAAEIERRGREEEKAAIAGGYSERPKEDDSEGEGEGRVSPLRQRSGSRASASQPPSPTISVRPPGNSGTVMELTEAELAMANANLMARLGPFLTTPLVQLPVTLFFYNDHQSQSRTVETNDAGHFSMRAGLNFVPTHVRVLANEDLSTVQDIEITDDEGISVISDIDDTIKHSSISLGAREIFRNTFIRDLAGLTIDGVREWYSELHSMGVRFHYCSNSPWQLFPVIATFFRHAGLPPGSLHLKQYSGMLQGIFEPVAERKKGTLDKILRDFPARRFILVGDSGEADLEVYTDLAIANPGRILGIFIRDVTTPEKAGYFDASVSGLPTMPSRRQNTSIMEPPQRPDLPARAISAPSKQEGPAEGMLIDFSDEPAPMDEKEESKLDKFKDSSSGAADLAASAVRGKKPPPPLPKKPAALKGEASKVSSKTGESPATPEPPVPPRKPVATQIKNALPHPLTQIQNSSQQSLRINSGQGAKGEYGSTATTSSATSIRSTSQAASSPGSNPTKQPPPPPPPRRRVTPLLNLSPRFRPLRHSNSNPDIEKLDLNVSTPPASEARPRPSRVNTAATFESMSGSSQRYDYSQGAQYSPVNKKLELWRRRLERAHELLDREGVMLYTWRRGEDVVLEAVGLVKKAHEEGRRNQQH